MLMAEVLLVGYVGSKVGRPSVLLGHAAWFPRWHLPWHPSKLGCSMGCQAWLFPPLGSAIPQGIMVDGWMDRVTVIGAPVVPQPRTVSPIGCFGRLV